MHFILTVLVSNVIIVHQRNLDIIERLFHEATIRYEQYTIGVAFDIWIVSNLS